MPKTDKFRVKVPETNLEKHSEQAIVWSRWTWRDSVCFISDNWQQLMQFFDERDDNRDNKKTRKILEKMKCSLVAKEIGFIAALRFIRKNITESESSDFTTTKAVKVLYSLFTKLHDFSETNDLAASAALRKLIQVSREKRYIAKSGCTSERGRYLRPFADRYLRLCQVHISRGRTCFFLSWMHSWLIGLTWRKTLWTFILVKYKANLWFLIANLWLVTYFPRNCREMPKIGISCQKTAPKSRKVKRRQKNS